MSNREDLDKHALNLGKLVGNLLSIEMGARLAIVKNDEKLALQVLTQLPQVEEGDQVEWNAFTNSDDLRKTLEKYNKRVPNSHKIDVKPIVDLRDAIAHGRTFGFGDIRHLRLLKFGRKSIAGKVTVELARDMKDSWFSENIEILNNAIEKIRATLDYEKIEFK